MSNPPHIALRQIMIWDDSQDGYVDLLPNIKAFFDDLDAVCEKHGLSIEHQDGQGAFIVVRGHEFPLVSHMDLRGGA